MTSNYRYYDTELEQNVDLDDYFITDAWLIDQYVGNQIWAWGRNDLGNLGQGNIVHRSSPVQVGSLTNWTLPSVGYAYNSAAIKTDGTLWTWGYNSYGQLGLGDIVHRSSPVQVGTLTNWKQVSKSRYYTAAIKTDGTLWTWGHNAYGQLGLGNIVHRSSPVQVGSLTNWTLLSVGYFNNSAAIKTDGTLWTWGANDYGNLGLGDRTHRSSPVQVGSLTNWKQVSAGLAGTAAIKTDGTLWTWGRNDFGNLGLGDNTHRSSPVQVGSLTNWKQVSAATGVAAVKTDGTLWTWGRNNTGVLGLGDTTDRSSPVQVGALTNWKQVSGGDRVFAAIKTDGTLWTWGSNAYGQLGLGDRTNRSSPVQVGSLTNWKLVSAGTYHAIAVTYTEI